MKTRPTTLTRAALLAAPLFPLAVAPAPGQFYGDPPDEHHPWAVHDANRPQPPRVEPGEGGAPPSDAVVLFDGTRETLDRHWRTDKRELPPVRWEIVEGGVLRCVPGSGGLRTVDEFGDCQLHVEWAAPTEIKGSSQGRGNSGVFLMGRTEVQVLDNYDNPTYADGFAGSVYGVNPPMANPLRGPGGWQSYDIVFRRPIFRDGVEVDPGYLTVFVNGVLVQDHTPLEGGGGHRGRSRPRPFPEAGPLKLQDHGNKIRYRNIWYRPLPPRAIEGGTDGRLTAEATRAKRGAIAAEIREDAANKEGVARFLRLMESLCYEQDAPTLKQVTKMADGYVGGVEGAAVGEIEGRKNEVLQVNRAVTYMLKHKLLPGDFPAAQSLSAVIKKQGWDKKR